MSGWDRLIVLMGLTGWLLLASTATVPALLAKSRETNDTGPTAETVLAALTDGAYQFRIPKIGAMVREYASTL